MAELTDEELIEKTLLLAGKTTADIPAGNGLLSDDYWVFEMLSTPLNDLSPTFTVIEGGGKGYGWGTWNTTVQTEANTRGKALALLLVALDEDKTANPLRGTSPNDKPDDYNPDDIENP